MKKCFCLLLISVCAGLMSCESDDNNVIEDSGIAVKSIQANSCVDLSNRTDWVLLVNSIQYNCTKEGNGLIATVKEKTCHFKPGYEKGSMVFYGAGPAIQLVAPGYHIEKRTKSMAPTPPDIADQTTLEKMLRADKLSTYYSGIVSENLTDVELTHANALLEFEVIGVLANTKVLVNSYMPITPFKEGDNKYKTIVLAEGGAYDANIKISIGGKYYSVSLRETMQTKLHPITGSGHIQRDTHYKFTVEFDSENEVLQIKNVQKSQWSESITWIPEG